MEHFYEPPGKSEFTQRRGLSPAPTYQIFVFVNSGSTSSEWGRAHFLGFGLKFVLALVSGAKHWRRRYSLFNSRLQFGKNKRLCQIQRPKIRRRVFDFLLFWFNSFYIGRFFRYSSLSSDGSGDWQGSTARRRGASLLGAVFEATRPTANNIFEVPTPYLGISKRCMVLMALYTATPWSITAHPQSLDYSSS